jgi:ABC-type dipeptide/oligopeptide/nickel transport system ATPase subunit
MRIESSRIEQMAAQQLIEREAEWAALAARWAAIDAPAAPGAVVLVRAEAGGGKTALLRAFAAAQGLEVGNTHADGAAGVPSAHEAWWCSVEQRLAPEPLAALRDIRAALQPPARRAAASGWRAG